MSVMLSTLSEKHKAFQHKTTRKIIRDMVIKDIGSFKQKTCRALLNTLMDIVDIEANGLECMSKDDRAGISAILS